MYNQEDNIVLMNARGESDPEEAAVHKRAVSRFLRMWDASVGADEYVKHEWCDIHGELMCYGEIEELMWQAELLYEKCQGDEWPSQFED